MTETRIRVEGKPAPQGSKKVVGGNRSGRAILVESSDALKPWRERIAWTAREQHAPLYDEALSVTLVFVMPRPKSTPKITPRAVKRPDIDKLTRGALDALTGVCWNDDSQVVTLHAHKRLAEPLERPGLHIVIRPMTGEIPCHDQPQ